MRFKLPSFSITVRDLTEQEHVSNTRGIAEGRDYFAIDIRAKCGDRCGDKSHTRGLHTITLCVGSPVIMTAGETWNEAAAARSAISFASAPWCADDDSEREWMESHGEDLTNESFSHRVLGAELREGC